MSAMQPAGAAAVSIDLDNVDCYFRIHGLGAAPASLSHVVYERAVPRAVALLAQVGAPATWFVIGRDVDAEHGGAPAARAAAALRDRARCGDELGNHSYSHPYALAKLPRDQQRDELERCHRVLCALGPVTGFRSPGYDVSPSLLAEVAAQGYRYDSSMFAAPAYYAAKAAVMLGRRLWGSASGAAWTEPRALLAPRRPYRVDPARPWRRGAGPLVELPIAVTPRLRLPVIGTSLLVAPRAVALRLIDAVAGEPLVNLELHGLDFADAAEDELPRALVERQPDLRVPWQAKAERLGEILARLAGRHPLITLAQAAAQVA